MHSKGQSQSVAEAACIRPSYVWPAASRHVNHSTATCAEEGFVQTGSTDVQLTALFSGCGPNAAAVAVAASDALRERLKPLVENPSSLDGPALETAFNQCHEQLLQHHQQQPQQQQHNSTSSSSEAISQPNRLDVSHSGTSALLAVIDQQQQRLLVASSGLCRAVLARSSSTGDLTVMELTPYMALGHDATETARLDAAGSSICCLPPAGQSLVHRDYKGTAAAAASSYNNNAYTGANNACISPSDAVLIDRHGQLLSGVKASRMLGYTAAAAAGVVATPVVTSWRLNGAESFLILGTPGIWAIMSPAEVADYVAAAIAAGVGSSTTTPTAAAPAAAAAEANDCSTLDANANSSIPSDLPQPAAAAAVVSLGDLLTLEAQERLKLRLMDRLFGLCPGPATAGLCGSGVVPDVSAVVLQLGASPMFQGARSAVDQAVGQRVAAELASVTRSCHSNAEALAQQAQWSAAAAAAADNNNGPASSANSPNRLVNGPHALSAGGVTTSCNDARANSKHQATPAREQIVTPQVPPPARSPAPALSSLLPLLTVAGGCWPAMYWPSSSSIRVPDRAARAAAAAAAAAAAGQQSDGSSSSRGNLMAVSKADGTSDGSSGKLSFDDAAAAAGLLRRSSSRSISGSGTQNSATRSSAFALSSRLSCELDLTHDHGSQGSCGCLAADCSTPAAAAAEAAAAVESPCEQSMILHKVRLSGPGELESLLFANATTAYPDTTVARVMRPWTRKNAIGGSLPAWQSSDPLSLGAAAAAGDLTGSSSSVMARAYSHAALQHQHPPKRSASVLIAALNMNQRHAAEAAAAAADHGSGSSGGASGNLQRAAASVPSGSSSPLLYSYSGRPIHSYDRYSQLQQQQQQQQQAELGSVKKARSYQALSALQAAAAAAGTEQQLSPVQSANAELMPGGGGYLMFGSFCSAFGLQQQQQRAMSALPSSSNASPLAAAATGVSMPLSCPRGASITDLLHPEDSEGRVRGGVTRNNRSSSFRSSLDAADAAGAESLAGCGSAAAASPTAAAADDHEGKVRHGVPRGRSRSLLILGDKPIDQATKAAAAAAAVEDQAGPDSVSRAPPVSAFASAAMQPAGSSESDSTVSSKSSSDGSSSSSTAAAAGRQLTNSAFRSAFGESARSGVQIGSGGPNAAAAKLLIGNPAPSEQALQQQQVKPESSVRGGRARAARMRAAFSSPNLPSLSVTSAAADPALEAAALKPYTAAAAKQAAAATDDTNSKAVDARLHSSSAAHDGSSSSLFGSRAVAGGAPVSTGTSSPSPSFSSAFAEAAAAAAAAAAAVPGSSSSVGMDRQGSSASQGCEVSDGAVHGGELGDESLEGQVHNGRRSNSLSTSLSGLLPTLSGSLSPPEDSALSSSTYSPASPAAAAASARRAVRRSRSSIGYSSTDRSAEGAAADSSSVRALQHGNNSGSSGGIRDHSFVSVNPARGSVSVSYWYQQQQGADGAAAPAIEVVRMPSGSFTRVRQSASAPAAAAAAGAQGLAGSSSSYGIGGGLLYEQVGAVGAGSPARAAAGSSSSSLHSSSVVQGLDRRVASSAGSASSGSGSDRAAAAAAGSWSSSRAWGSSGTSGSSRRPAIQFGKVQLQPSAFAAAAAGVVADSTSARQRSSADGSSFQAGLTVSPADVHFHPRSAVELGFGSITQHTSSSARRQMSQTLPTLKETPTPGSSPQIGSSSSASRTLDITNISDLGDLAAQQQQQMQLQQQIRELLQEASFSDQQLSDHAAGTAPDQQGDDLDHRSGDLVMSPALSDHSATDLVERRGSSQSPISAGSLTDMLLDESVTNRSASPEDPDHEDDDLDLDDDLNHDQICPPGSSMTGSVAQTTRHSFEFGRHIQADAFFGCSPAPISNPARPFRR